MWLLKHQQQLKQTLWLIMVCVLPILSNSKMIEKWSQIACLYCCCCCCRVRRRRFLSKSFQWKRKFLWLLWWYYWVEWTWTSICGGMCVLKDLNLFYPSLCLTSIGKICNIFFSLSLKWTFTLHCFKISLADIYIFCNSFIFFYNFHSTRSFVLKIIIFQFDEILMLRLQFKFILYHFSKNACAYIFFSFCRAL